MKRAGLPLLLIFWGFLATPTSAAQPIPWVFGMTPEQVKAQAEYGPYRSFSNGDLETYNGVWDGQKQNFQFFFKQGKLVRIGIDLYEGHDLSVASEEWLKLYEGLRSKFGQIETPDAEPPIGDGRVFMDAAQKRVELGDEPQMAPVRQPTDTFIYAGLKRYEAEGQTYFNVFLFLDPPRA
ncbi:MAG TPA: hypothetical protein VN693_01130 [Rhodanobacteraceae bacterium]|nr:hypothetical protein [Rhodanobacteraceae bacterium]